MGFSIEAAEEVIRYSRRFSSVATRPANRALARAAAMVTGNRLLVHRYDGRGPVLEGTFWMEVTATPRNVMIVLNWLARGYGVESLSLGEPSEPPEALYVNLGEAYTPTFLYDAERNEFRVTSWGDFVEEIVRRREEEEE